MPKTITNADRAKWAGSALQRFRKTTGADHEDALGDLLCDLMHWSDANNFDFGLALSRARGHYAGEIVEADESLGIISIKWSIDDVKEVRPDLTDDECLDVLTRVHDKHDANVGVNWDIIKLTADILFPEGGAA
jgi:hypothetical protein